MNEGSSPVLLKRVSTAARNALFDPATWIPAAGAAIFTIDNWDEKTATWAARHTPVFGSQESAQDAGGTLNTALSIETLATAIATPSGDDPLDWSLAKARGLSGKLPHHIHPRCVHEPA
jgi:hypothetical protein